MHFPCNSPLVPITSLGPLRALQTLTTTERKKAKISNEDDFFTHKRRFFFDFGPFVDRCWSVFLFHHKKKKKKICRERETWQQKKERDFRFSLKRHTTQKSRIITHHHNRSSFFSAIQRHFSATPLFVSERDNFVRRSRFCSFFSRRGLHVLVVAS